MTVAAAAAIPARTADKLRNWLSVRHSLPSEAAAVLGLYGLYQLARGLVVGDAREADHHAREVVALERWLHLFLEASMQHAARTLPGLTSLLGTAYLTLHLARQRWGAALAAPTTPRCLRVRSHRAPARQRTRPPRLPRLSDRAAASGRDRHRRHRLERPRRPQQRSCQRALQPLTPPSPACTSATR